MNDGCRLLTSILVQCSILQARAKSRCLGYRSSKRLGLSKVCCGSSAWTVRCQTSAQADQDRGSLRASRPRYNLPTGRGGRYLPDGTHHPRCHPPIASATTMHAIAISVQTELKQQYSSARYAEHTTPWPGHRGFPVRSAPFQQLAPRQTPLGAKTLVQRAKLADLNIERYATWIMSDQ